MQIMLLKSFLVVILLIDTADRSQCCMCLKYHKQELYCQADFVLQVKVKAEEIIYRETEEVNTDPETNENITQIDKTPESRKYTVKVRKAFKIKENHLGLTRHSSVATMYTSYYEYMCGVQLQPNEKYITTGYFEDDQLSLKACDWVEPWFNLSKAQKTNVKSKRNDKSRRNDKLLYEMNCDCQVVNIEDNGYQNESTNALCEWDAFSSEGECYDLHSACVRNKNKVLGECKWHRNRPLKNCLNNVKRRR